MKKYGKVISYDGCTGTIIDVDGIEYLFTKNELFEEININDCVCFNFDIYHDVELTRFMARFITRVDNKN